MNGEWYTLVLYVKSAMYYTLYNTIVEIVISVFCSFTVIGRRGMFYGKKII
jgi:hypothetical protein